MVTRAQQQEIRAYFAAEPLVPARITAAVARRFGVDTVADAWQHLYDIMESEREEALARERARRDRWNAEKRRRRAAERELAQEIRDFYERVRNLPDNERLTREQRRERYEARQRYLDVSLNVTVKDPRRNEPNFPAAYAERTYATTETLIGVAPDRVRERLDAIQQRRGWVSYAVTNIVSRALPNQYVANIEFHYAYIKKVRNTSNRRWYVVGDLVIGGAERTSGLIVTTKTETLDRNENDGLGVVKAEAVEEFLGRRADDSVEPILLGAKVTVEATENRQRGRQAMRLAFAYGIDGTEDQPWNKGEGTCVIDFLVARYGELRGLKKSVTRERLLSAFSRHAHLCPTWDDDEVLEEWEEVIDDPVDGLLDDDDPRKTHAKIRVKHSRIVEPVYDPAKHGVCAEQIREAFCREYNIPMYALDDAGNVFMTYAPNKPNHNYPSLCFKVFDNHMYPVTQKNKVMAISQATVIGKKAKSNEVERESPAKANKMPVEVIDATDADTVELFLESIAEGKTYPKARQDGAMYGFNGKDVLEWVMDGKRYVLAENIEEAQRLCERMGKEYAGQSLSSLLIDIMNEKEPLIKSHMNPIIYNLFTSREQKRRAHRGFYGACDLREQSGLSSYDINKCYTYCLYRPMMDWGVIDFNDTLEVCDITEKTTTPIQDAYYVLTSSDRKLFVGHGIYSAPMLRKAIAEGIPFHATHKLVPRTWVAKETTTKLIDRVRELCDDDAATMKVLNNKMTGMFGKTTVKKCYARVTRSKDDVLSHFSEKRYKKNTVPFIRKREVAEQTFWMYGFESKIEMTETNMPWYIQITDQANIMLYDLVKACGGFDRLVYRNTDCVVMKDGLVPNTGTEWGEYHEIGVPHMTRGSYLDAEAPSMAWRKTLTWEDSTYAKYIAREIVRNGGGLVFGRAGTGKTYVAKQFAASIGERCARIAFTNKAALTVGGQTIHRLLGLDEELKMSAKMAEKIKSKYDWIIVDEISMVSKAMWSRLAFLKRLTGIRFLLLGDHRQCSPVEDENIEHYFQHDAPKYIARGLRCELTVPHRYDLELWDVLENVYEERPIDISRFAPVYENETNICFFNETRVRINKQMMEARKPEGALFLSCRAGDDYSQDVWVYEGLPVIARHNKDKGSTLANNEAFVVKSVTEEGILCRSKLRDSEYICPVEEFQKMFLPAYCVTTHKSQGDTIKEPFTIWDWAAMDKRLRYTAMSRAQRLSQISIVKGEGIRWGALERAIEKKIRGHEATDRAAGRTCNLDVRYVRCLMVRQGFQCAKQKRCCGDLKLGWTEPNDPGQFTIDRIKTDRGHVKGNVVITCLSCNSATYAETM